MRWSYKTVHFSLKKEGLLGSAFLDEAEIEISLNEYGKSGWELVSFMEVNDGLIAVFKQPFAQGLPYLEEADRSEELTGSKPEPETVASLIPAKPGGSGEKTLDPKKNENDGSDETDVGSIRIL